MPAEGEQLEDSRAGIKRLNIVVLVVGISIGALGLVSVVQIMF